MHIFCLNHTPYMYYQMQDIRSGVRLTASTLKCHDRLQNDQIILWRLNVYKALC